LRFAFQVALYNAGFKTVKGAARQVASGLHVEVPVNFLKGRERSIAKVTSPVKSTDDGLELGYALNGLESIIVRDLEATIDSGQHG